MGSRRTTFTAIGTKWSLVISSDLSGRDWSKLLSSIEACIEKFDKTFSRFRPNSWVTKMSQAAGRYPIPDNAFLLLQFYEQLYKVTGGKVTPLIGKLMSDAGYDANYSFQSRPLSKPPTWEEAMSYSQKYIDIKKPVLLDFGAAGKGYLVDIISGLLQEAGLTDYVIDASGDILHRSNSNRAISIGLEDPQDRSLAVGIVELSNQSLCASSGSRRAWGNFTHIINPASLQSPKEIMATWVVANDTMTADGLATALFFTSPDNLSRFDFSFAILDKHRQLEYSRNFPANVFEAVAA